MKLAYISFLRSLSIILVVTFHVYGYMYADHFLDTKDLYRNLYYWTNQCFVINIAMPMFTFISGFLFCNLYKNKNKYREFVPFVKDKATRLWLPYFVFGFIMMATTGNFHPLKLLYGSYWHLWFLPTLFWCFIIEWFALNRCSKQVRLIVLLVALLLPLCGEFLPKVMGIRNTTTYYSWFCLGSVVAQYEKEVVSYIRRWHLYILMIGSFIWVSIQLPWEYGSTPEWYHMISTSFMLLSVWHLASRFNIVFENKCKVLLDLSKYSFGIYIFHNWIGLYLVGNLSQRLFHLPYFTANYPLLFPLGLTLVVFCVSLTLSWFTLKLKMGQQLIG